MARKFPDFLTAYEEFCDDGFIPPQFNTWAALSVIAGAMERKVWLPWNERFSFYPNIYVLLVSPPGQGKSVSTGNAVDLLRELHRKTSAFNFMPAQVTEAKFIELMGHGKSFTYKAHGKELLMFQNAGYYYASEASNSLRNIFGDFIACLTDFYDCPVHWERATKKDGKRIVLKNVCMNILAGSTFDYLGKLVNDDNIQGGFASRLLYVVQWDPGIRIQKWQSGITETIKQQRISHLGDLYHDLQEISQLIGPMAADKEFADAWETWYPAHQAQMNALKSEKLRAIYARTNTNVLKLSMLLSASESDDRVLHLRHFEKARALVEGLNADIPRVFVKSAAAQGVSGGPGKLRTILMDLLNTHPNCTKDKLVDMAVASGQNKMQSANVVDAMLNCGTFIRGNIVAGDGIHLRLKDGAYNDL